jgi:hypothetical protein
LSVHASLFLRTCQAIWFLSHVHTFPCVGFGSISVPRSLLHWHGSSLWHSSCGTSFVAHLSIVFYIATCMPFLTV